MLGIAVEGLGGHEAQCACCHRDPRGPQLTLFGDLLRNCPGEAEVGELGIIVLHQDEDVLWLQVPEDNAVVVEVLQRKHHTRRVARADAGWQALHSAADRLCLQDPLVQVLVAEFHEDAVERAGAKNLYQLHDVGMQACGTQGLRFPNSLFCRLVPALQLESVGGPAAHVLDLQHLPETAHAQRRLSAEIREQDLSGAALSSPGAPEVEVQALQLLAHAAEKHEGCQLGTLDLLPGASLNIEVLAPDNCSEQVVQHG
mmetsp:Transcript_48840/g.110647  ORF Transcript_48840/g.110647 Transcript_48840/m.110647 type:complete len:257 (-) Transcript_48840:136-906(-)